MPFERGKVTLVMEVEIPFMKLGGDITERGQED